MPNKAGVQAQIASTAFKSMVRATWPYTLKILDGARDRELVNEWALARRARGGGLLMLRYVTGDGVTIGDLDRLTAEALRLFDGWQGFADGVRVILELPINEKFHTGYDDFRMLAGASLAAARTVKAAGFTPGVLITSEGNPPDLTGGADPFGARFFLQPDVLDCLRQFRRMGAVWCPHAYSHPPAAPDDTWHFDRPRHILAQLPEDARLNYAVGEFGCDGGCDLPDKKPGQGWRAYFDPDEGRARRYRDFLRAQVRVFAADPLCVGAALFVSGADPSGNPNFVSFDVGDEVDLRTVFTEDVPGPAITWLPADKEQPMPTLRGIDVSNNQGGVNWAAVKASGVEFAMIKASGDEGPSNVYLDGYFPRNWLDAGAVPMVRGAYHYARPSAVSPSQSVTTFQRALQAVGGLKAGDLIALDIEDPNVPDGTSLHVWVAEWLALAEQVFGVAAFKYSGRYFTSTHDLEHADLERFPTWWASWQPTKPAAVTGWTPITLWQTSDKGSVPGVTGACDLNQFEGTVADLRAFGLRSPAPTPVPTPPPTPVPTPSGFDIDAARYRLWAEAEELQANGWGWFGTGIKSLVATSKGDR